MIAKTATNTLPQEALLAPSPTFRQEVTRSVMAIVAFIAVYIILFFASLGLAGLCVYAGIALILVKPAFITLVAGGGIIGCGVMVFVFLIKFLFSSSKADNSKGIEIRQEDQPLLFETIYDLARETGAPLPKKIFLSPDVNAAVFYNSSFWSMFLPVKKNLKIGLGLVNALNVSELKAVIAHEFGHFSQRSMKVGSWVYQVNKIIHDMLYNNTGYARSLNSIASLHGIVALFLQLTVQFVKGIQWVLNQMFRLVNKSYMGLSRQMEFHADLVAASVCGSNNIINALKRIEFAEKCFAPTLDVCNWAWKEKKVVDDFYENHSTVIRQVAALNQLKLVNGLPEVQQNESQAAYNRVNFKNQWASHPTLNERDEYLQPFGLQAPSDSSSAWSLFRNKEALSKKLTEQFYENIPAEEIKGAISVAEFEDLFVQKLEDQTLAPEFREYYNNRAIYIFDPETAVQAPFAVLNFDEVLTEDAVLLPKRLHSLEEDIAVLQAITAKQIETASFDFNGKKYRREEAEEVLEQLVAEKETVEKSMEATDEQLFRYFYAALPLPEAQSLKSKYQLHFQLRRQSDHFFNQANSLLELLGPIFRGQTLSVEDIQHKIHVLKGVREKDLKQQLSYWKSEGAFDTDPSLKEEVQKFLASDYKYFSGSHFCNNELADLHRFIDEGWECVRNFIFLQFKNITETQAAVLKKGVKVGK